MATITIQSLIFTFITWRILQYKTIRSSSTQFSVPERVTYTILKVNKVVVIDPHEVSAVEVKISFLQNITKSFPLRLLLVLGVANKRSNVCDLRHQQSCLTLEERQSNMSLSDLSHHWGPDWVGKYFLPMRFNVKFTN